MRCSLPAVCVLQESREILFSVNDPSPGTHSTIEAFKATTGGNDDPVSAIAANENVLMIGRSSGVVQKYT
jgi:hypothetical protein